MNLPAHKKMLSAAAAASVMLMTAACGGSDSEGASSSESATSAPAGDSASDASSAETYVDGDYEADGSYSNPSGVSSIAVEVTLADGTITDVTVTPQASDGTSRSHQQDFAGGIAAEVVGKSIDELDVGTVAGSSLTVQGFTVAINQIKAEAQA